MNALHIRISILAALVAAASSSALAHKEYGETGPYHWIQHVAEAKLIAKGVYGPTRTDNEPSAVPRATRTAPTSQPSDSPFQALGGIGGDGTN